MDVSCYGLFFGSRGCIGLAEDTAVDDDFVGACDALDEGFDFRGVDLFDLVLVCEVGDLPSIPVN